MPVPNTQWKTPDDGQRNCPKHVESRTKINLEIGVSVGFIVKKLTSLILCTFLCVGEPKCVGATVTRVGAGRFGIRNPRG